MAIKILKIFSDESFSIGFGKCTKTGDFIIKPRNGDTIRVNQNKMLEIASDIKDIVMSSIEDDYASSNMK